MTQLSESVQWSRRRRANKVERLLNIVYAEDMEKGMEKLKKLQFQQDCRDIWLQCNGKRKLYRQMITARKKFLGRG